jgi:hypothetical protein
LKKGRCEKKILPAKEETGSPDLIIRSDAGFSSARKNPFLTADQIVTKSLLPSVTKEDKPPPLYAFGLEESVRRQRRYARPASA